MSFLRRHIKLIAVATSCVAIGGGVSAIATAGAATTAATTTPTAKSAKAGGAGKARSKAAKAILSRAVHGSLLLATKNGFVTVTFDRGTVQSVQGQQLTIVEGAKSATHKTVTLTIPSNAIVRDNGKKASLSSITAGQRVQVVQGLKRTRVVARTPRTA